MHVLKDRTMFLFKTLKPQTFQIRSDAAINKYIYGQLIKIHNLDPAENSNDDTYTQRSKQVKSF